MFDIGSLRRKLATTWYTHNKGNNDNNEAWWIYEGYSEGDEPPIGHEIDDGRGQNRGLGLALDKIPPNGLLL